MRRRTRRRRRRRRRRKRKRKRRHKSRFCSFYLPTFSLSFCDIHRSSSVPATTMRVFNRGEHIVAGRIARSTV
jgi:hypothetical protein